MAGTYPPGWGGSGGSGNSGGSGSSDGYVKPKWKQRLDALKGKGTGSKIRTDNLAYSLFGKEGKGLTDIATLDYASALAGKHGTGSIIFRDYTTFLTGAGERIAKGTFQTVGLTAATLGFGTGMTGGKVTGDTGLTAYEFAAKYQKIGVSETGESLYFPRTTPQVPSPPAARGMVGIQTTSYAPATDSGIGRALMGGMGKGDWDRPQKPKEVEEKSMGSGIATVAVLGGVGYLIWTLLK